MSQLASAQSAIPKVHFQHRLESSPLLYSDEVALSFCTRHAK